MASDFAKRLQEMVEAVRTEAEHAAQARASGAAAARARRRHLEKAAMAEVRTLAQEASGVLAGCGLRARDAGEEVRVEVIPGARPPEKFPPWLAARCRPPAFEDVRVAVVEIQWRVDDPRTPLPEAPNTIRHVADDDSPAGLAGIRDFIATAFEEFVAAVTRADVAPGA